MGASTFRQFAVWAALIAIATFAYSLSVAAGDIYLRCNGVISILRASGVQLAEGQEIAAHLKGSRISFSGNALLAGENIEICTPLKAEPYFDSESCRGQTRTHPRRSYGTLNKITGMLNLTNTMSDGPSSLIEGKFKCAQVVPAVR